MNYLIYTRIQYFMKKVLFKELAKDILTAILAGFRYFKI